MGQNKRSDVEANVAFVAAQQSRSANAAQALARMAARVSTDSGALGALIRQQKEANSRWEAIDSELLKVVARAIAARCELRARIKQSALKTTNAFRRN